MPAFEMETSPRYAPNMSGDRASFPNPLDQRSDEEDTPGESILKYVLVLGGPGSGKSTLCQGIAQDFSSDGFVHLCVHNLPNDGVNAEVRSEIADCNADGKPMSAATVVPLLKKLMQEESKSTFLIDGFPETLEQSELLLQEVGDPVFAIVLDVSRDIMIERACKGAGAQSEAGDDDEDDGVLEKRLRTHRSESALLITHLEDLKLVRLIDAEEPSADDVLASARRLVEVEIMGLADASLTDDFDRGGLTDDELSDLAYAFQACDGDSNGALEVHELHAMISALGGKATVAQVEEMMREAKRAFASWRNTSIEQTGKVEYHPILLYHGQEPGAHGETKHGMTRHHPELAIQKPNTVARAFRNQNKVVERLHDDHSSQQERLTKISQKLVHDEHDDLHDLLHELMEDHSQLIYAEYVMMLTGKLFQKYVHGDWHKAAWKMRIIKNGYDTADFDGSGQVSEDDLEMVMAALDPQHGLTHQDIDYLWGVLNPGGLSSLNFHEYLHGLSFAQADSKCKDWCDFAKPNKWELLSLIIDTPHSKEEEKDLLADLSPIERVGINLLTHMHVPMEREHIREVLTRAGEGHLRKITDSQVSRMKAVHIHCCLWCAWVGFFFNVPVAAFENWLVDIYETDGMTDAYWVCSDYNDTVDYDMMCAIEPKDEGRCTSGWEDMDTEAMCRACGACDVCMCLAEVETLIPWWSWNMANVLGWVVIEIGLLMYFCAKYCVKVSWALDFRLVPLNADRAFVADSLVRAAFELGNPDSVVMGVDPHAESSAAGNLRTAIAMALYKGKIVVHGALHKFILGQTTSPSFYMWAKPWLGTVLCSALWDSLVAHVIINQAEVRGIGVYTSVELFNDVVALHFQSEKEISDRGRINMVRAVGVAIVKQGSMYCTMELLLRHTIQYLGLRGRAVLSKPGTLDNEFDFVDDLREGGLTKDEQVVVLSIHLLAHMLDGTLNRTERRCWRAAVDAVNDDIAQYYDDRLTYLCWRFRNYHYITAQDLHDCFRPEAEIEYHSDHKCSEAWYNFTACLTC
jgi:adenylate kinase family enzyme/Ca2+-binding EF-hand superfamily protein